ncbi:MAG: OsmC family protein [Bacteroidota bacterium]|nr:OsmC family protein [Bacteroidota bacterium]
MLEKITMKWQESMSFEATIGDNKLTIDATPEHGGQGKGPGPKPLMLTALAGCSGMDVVSLLAKMLEKLEEFDMTVEADMTEEHPKVYTRFTIEYHLKGETLNQDKVIKSVKMSQEKYCGVAAMLRKVAPLDFKIFLNEKQLSID